MFDRQSGDETDANESFADRGFGHLDAVVEHSAGLVRDYPLPPGPSKSVGTEPGATATTLQDDPLAVALAAVERALTQGPGSLCDSALSAQILACARLIERTRALQMLTVGPWDTRTVWMGESRSASGWLHFNADMLPGESRSLLRAAHLAGEHDAVSTRLTSGELSARKVDLLAGAATSDRTELFARDVELLARGAASMRTDSVATFLRRWKALADDDLASRDAAHNHDRRRCHHSPIGEGWKLDGHFGADDGAVIDAALKDAMDPPDDPDRPGGTRTSEQRRADALVRLARFWADTRNQGHATNPVVSFSVHASAAALAGSSDDGFDPATLCDLVPGGPVARSTAQRLLCGSAVGRVLLDAKGEVLDLGRQQRLFTPAQKRAMIARDGPWCIVPGCRIPAEWCEAHHFDPWEAGGPTDLANGGHVCSGNHHDIHDRGYRIERLPTNVYRFTAPDGRCWTGDGTPWGVILDFATRPIA